MANNTCDYASILKSTDACEFVLQYCEYTYINFYKLHYCTFDQRLYLIIPIFILIIFFCFRLLSSTANIYLSSSLTTLSERLGVSQSLAGVTFLALGNGAPDVISSIVASDTTENPNINFALGALAGGGIFITTLVFSLVVYYSRSVKVQMHLFIRDIVFYIIAICLIFVFSFNGEIQLVESILFLCLYIV
jgi:sodium/potassium/calcium exchanger 6